MPVGLDIGTMNIVSARTDSKGKTVTKRIRDAFVELPISAKKMLKLNKKVSYVEEDNRLLILGDEALEFASVFGKTARRPLQDGLINPSEQGSLDVLMFMIENVLGEPQRENEVCYFSIPADPIDNKDRNTVYHKGIFERIISELGYDPVASNEAEAIVFSECSDTDFNALAFSFGSGMTNICMVLNTFNCLEFSVCRGGDWIDKGVATSTGKTQGLVTSLKEKGFDLNDPQDRIQEALSFYYKELILYGLKYVSQKFIQSANQFGLQKEIPVIVSGGTSKPKGFVEFFQKTFDKNKKRYPFKISEIRQATDPLNAVAYGLLVQATQEEQEEQEEQEISESESESEE